MFIISLGGVVAVVATIWIGRHDQVSNSKDTAVAINQMASIAHSIAAERPAVERQANASADSADAAKITARLARNQTGAIIRQADALIHSAEASSEASDVQLSAAKAILIAEAPSVRFNTLEVTGFQGPPPTSSPPQLFIHFSFINVSNVTLYPRQDTFNIAIVASIPDKPPVGHRLVVGGNDFAVSPHSAWGPNYHVIKYERAELTALNERKKQIIIWGDIVVSDTSGKEHRVCYAYAASFAQTSIANLSAIDFPAYTCAAT